jgi:uncharacterized membrane protein
VFAGLGSRWSRRLAFSRRLPLAVSGIALFSLAYVVALPPLLGQLATLGDVARIGVAALVIAPLAFCMGVPFPTGLTALASGDPRLVPWAWAVNGCASVTGAGLATLLAVHWGFTAVVVLAVALYGVALISRVRLH